MTPSERERRIKAASDALQLKVAAHAMKGIDDWPALVEAALDAANEAVPMVSEAEYKALWESLRKTGEQRDRAEAAATEFAQAIRRWLSETGPGMHVNTALGRGMARQALARHPSFSGEEGAE